MTQLNHINLGVSNVPELVRFFTEAFGFRIEEARGTGKFAVLLGEDGFVLDSYEAVIDKHRRIVSAGFDAPVLAILERGGGKTFGFYTKPHGLMVEVSCPAA